MVRRAPACLAAAVIVLLSLASAASAAPTVRFKATAVPIAGYRGTGNIAGAGASIHAEYKIEGTEYAGGPAPLIGVKVFLPSGTEIHTGGFTTCPTSYISEEKEPNRCPRGSEAGPVGSVEGEVSIGSERVHEFATLRSFYAPGGGLNFFTYGHSPTILEIPSTGRYTNVRGTGGKGPEFTALVPLVESLPGAPDASVRVINTIVGSAYRRHGRVYYYGTMPRNCLKNYLPIRTELTFAALDGLAQTTVAAQYRAPCPKHSRR